MDRENIHKALFLFKEKIVFRFGPSASVVLFGSVARGVWQHDSDIDLLVLVPGAVDNSVEEEVFDLAYEVEIECGVVIGAVVYSRDFWETDLAKTMPLHRTILREGTAL